MKRRLRSCLAVCVAATAATAAAGAAAETMSGALARAYANNPELNAQRAGVRAIDEGVPQAKAGWMPQINAGGEYGPQYSISVGDPSAPGRQITKTPVANYNVTVTQTVFDGQRTSNSVRQAEHSVLAARELLRQAESDTLQVAATAYTDVLRDAAIVNLQRKNAGALVAEVQDARDRFKSGQVLRTDVAQAQTALATAQADLAVGRSNLRSSVASYRRVVGVEPRQLQPARPLEKLLPGRLDQAIAMAMERHPTIMGALYQADVAEAAVKVAEGALLPTAVAQGTAQQLSDFTGPPESATFFSASVGGQVNVPVYQGGAEYAAIRRAKEQLGQARLAIESQRAVVRKFVSTAWAKLAEARAAIVADEALVKANEFALMGVREEAKDGLRTVQDILNAHQALLSARTQLVMAQHDRVVASYAVMAAVGLLSARGLGLAAAIYDPKIHYGQTKNRLFGAETPDGR